MKKNWHFWAYPTWQHSSGTDSCCCSSLHHSPCSPMGSCCFVHFRCLLQMSQAHSFLGANGHSPSTVLTWSHVLPKLITLLRLFTPLHCDPIFFWYISHFLYLPPSWILLLSHFKKFLRIPFFFLYTLKRVDHSLSVFFRSGIPDIPLCPFYWLTLILFRYL